MTPKSYTLHKKGNQILLLFLPLWLAACLLMTGTIIYGMITDGNRFPELWLAVLVLLAIVLLVARMWLWHLRGKEILTAHHDHIEIARQGSFGFSKRHITISEIDSINSSPDNDTPRWLRWWGFSGGTIRIRYLGRAVRCGQDLSEISSATIVEELNTLRFTQPL